MNNQEILELSIADLAEDAARLDFLIHDVADKLRFSGGELRKVRQLIPQQVYTAFIGHSAYLDKEIQNTNGLIAHLNQSRQRLHTLDDLGEVIHEKNVIFDSIRSLAILNAALYTSTDWQSPSYKHSLYAMAGRQTGSIKLHMTDYKRDQQKDVFQYERKFVREYVDVPLKFNVGAYATSSGMAAFTTIINYLMIIKLDSPYIVVGKSIYFESRLMLEALYKDKCILVDESDTRSVISAIRRYEPGAVFLDTITNTENVLIVDLDAIITEMSQNSRNDPYLVIDNTVTGIMYQPFKNLLFKKHVNMIVYESLNKYHQFGLDRVTGGIIYLKTKHKEHIFDVRDHLGTLIPDINAISLPKPDRFTMQRYLVRLSRNTNTVATLLQKQISHTSKWITGVNSPILSGHPSSHLAKNLKFAGTFLTLSIHNRFPVIATGNYIIHILLREARRKNVQFIYGTSFGLPVTRIYSIDPKFPDTKNFIRIAPGTETMYEIFRMSEIFKKII